MNDLDECMLNVIGRGFPELLKPKITASYKKMADAYLEFTRSSRTNYHIDVDCSLRNVRIEVVLGGMAHELSHISKEIRMNQIASMIDLVLYGFLSKYQQWDERRTDLLAVERGFSKELLEFLRYADKRREEFTHKEGLTVRELESLVGE